MGYDKFSIDIREVVKLLGCLRNRILMGRLSTFVVRFAMTPNIT